MKGLDLIILIAVASGFIATLCFFTCIILAFKLRSANKRTAAIATTVEEEIAEFNRTLEAASKQATEQAQRIAWLESRVRPGTPMQRQQPAELLNMPARPSITERRYRVLSLARRGMDVSTIAAMLGEPHGEVELIIGLSSAA